jgi:hypothetical protein
LASLAGVDEGITMNLLSMVFIVVEVFVQALLVDVLKFFIAVAYSYQLSQLVAVFADPAAHLRLTARLSCLPNQ